MTPDANALDVGRLREILRKATRKHFVAYSTTEGPVVACHHDPDRPEAWINALAYAPDVANARLFAEAANALPTLLDRLDALEAENAKLRAVADAVPAVIAEADRETVSFQTLRRALAALTPSDSSGARKESQ